MNKNNQEFSTLSELQLLIATNWCKTNGWSELQLINDYEFYAIPPQAYLPVELPKDAIEELDKSRRIVDVLWQTQFLKKVSRANLNKAMIFNVTCIPFLYIKHLFISLTNYVNIPIVIYQLLNIVIGLLIFFTVNYLFVAICGYWEHYHSKKKLIKLGFTDLVVSFRK